MSNFLKLEGLSGESGNPRHKGEFDILSAVLGYRIPNQHTPINKSGKVFHDVNITRKQEEDSNKLMSASVSNKTFPGGKIILESTDKTITLDMSNISIISYSLDKSVETLSLSYEVPA